MGEFNLLRFMRRADWVEHANCRGSDPDLFYPHEGENTKAERAKHICRECDVQAECLAYALNNGELGIWGGTSERERRRIRQRETGRARGPIPPPHELVPYDHGTTAGYAQHRRRGTEPCAGCLEAHALDVRFSRPSRSVTA